MHENANPARQAIRLLLLAALLLVVILLAACGSQSSGEPAAEEAAPTEAPAEETAPEPTATPTDEPEPTEMPTLEPEPTATPTEEAQPTAAATAAATEEAAPQSPIDAMDHTPDPMLVDITWEWVKREPNGNSFGDITVPNPENYTLFFDEDGAFLATIDCNTAAGRYATTYVENVQKGIFMELGPMTMAACGEASLDTDMVNMFGPAQGYQFEDDGNTLVFIWAAAGPLDYYRNAETASADATAGEEATLEKTTDDPDPVTADAEAAEVNLPVAEAEAPTGRVVAEDGVNVRTGPGAAYPIVGLAPQGVEGEIVGVSEDGEWWVARVPAAPDEQGWVAAAYVEATNADDVPVIPAPPLSEGEATPVDAESAAPDELAPGSLILFSAARVVQDGNRTDEFEDIYSVPAAPGSEAALIVRNAKQPALQPDGKVLAFRSTQSDQLGLGGYDFEADGRVRYTSFEEDSTPSWSPAGDRIVFGSNRTGDRVWRIYIVEPIPGVNPGDLAEAVDLGFGEDPDWHPSENLIVFKGCDEAGDNCGLWTMGIDGSERTPITDGFNDSLPRWSPDGASIAFMSDSRDGNWELYRLSIADSKITRLTENPADDGHPAWHPDGSRLAFMSNRDEVWGVWIMPAEGGDAALVTTFEDVVPDWLLQGIDWPR